VESVIPQVRGDNIIEEINKTMNHQIVWAVSLISLFGLFVIGNVEESSHHHIERRWAEFPNVSFTFDCTDRAIGFYADLEHDCMIFHMCDEDGRRIPYMCANETSFNQKFRVCDWNYNVDCESSPDWYYLNDLTYRTDPPKAEYEDDFGIPEENIRK